MYGNLSGDNNQRELDLLYNMNDTEAKTAFSEIYGGTQAQATRLAPLNSGVGSSIFSRLDALPTSVNVNVNVPVKSLTAPTSADFYTSTIIPLEFDDKNSYWLKLIGGWEHVNATTDFAGTKSNNFGFVMGTDYQANKNWRLGTMIAYGKANIYNALNSGKIHDYRLGVYGGYKKEALELQTYLSFGKQDYDIDRNLSSLGKNAHSNYDALSLDLGVKAKYDLHHNDKKLWQVKPYLGLNLQSSWQDAYKETGAGVFSQQVDKFNNIYSTAGLALEISRKINNKGQYGFAVGYKRVLSGDNPELNARLIGDTSQSFRLSSIAGSKNIFSVEINAEGKLKNNWSIYGQAIGEFTNKSKAGFVSVSLRHSW